MLYHRKHDFVDVPIASNVRMAPVLANTMSATLVIAVEIIQTKWIATILNIGVILRMDFVIGVKIVEEIGL